ncbi:hypothetical protein sscle_10g076170 [Sclerotinia sclerotiorum 1980 UF-70]|uniref:Uncharacterized protein n=1 Tax=Sclerotinia sclerotiorum (strain ATCC 18683 / 1980 / Ss-1) TaxID=665079 RepID=A0A1D9QD34_SCLS1|nr:hypothetical protein sscle_10g076170 [Sclerotinia sclerotiorum 1980 UF-70]
MCNSLFQAEAETIRALSLESSFQEDPSYSQFYLGKEAAPVMALSVQALVPHCPQPAHMLLIDSRQRDYDDHSVCATFNRRNIIHNKIYCVPFVNIAPLPDGILVRTQDKDIIASLPSLQIFAEETLWKAISPEGFMLPAQLLEG